MSDLLIRGTFVVQESDGFTYAVMLYTLCNHGPIMHNPIYSRKTFSYNSPKQRKFELRRASTNVRPHNVSSYV